MYDVNNSTVDVSLINRNELRIPEKRCLVVNGTTLIPVKCNEEYYGICIYDIDLSLNDDNCKRKLNETCFSSNLGLLNKCYCINKHPYPRPRNSYCNKLTDIEDPYQNILLSKRFGEDEYCWFGLDRSKWVSNADSVKYSYWTSTNNFSKTYGAVGKHGWKLENDQALSCAVCEIDILNYRSVRLQLKRNFTNNKIQLEIHNALDAFKGVLCSTGNDSYFINLSTSMDDYILQDLWLFDDIKEYCWCKSLQLPNLQNIYSNKIIALHNNEQIDVFVSIWTIPIINDLSTLTYTCPEMKSAIVTHSKLFKTVYLKHEKKVKIVCHHYITKSNLTITEKIKILIPLLNATDMTLESFLNAKLCLPTITTSGNKTLHWRESPIGSTIVAEELCLQQSGEPVTRTCGGNSTFGAEWLAVNGSCMDTPISPTTVFLNDLLHKETSTENITTGLVRATTNNNNINSFQIHLVSQLLEKVAEQVVANLSLKDVVTTINNVMQVDTRLLKNSQETLNSTDSILWSLDNILIRMDSNVKETGYTNESSDKLLMQATSLIKSDIKGFKLQSSDTPVFNAGKLKPLYQYYENEYFEENLDLALLIPRDLRDNIILCDGSKANPTLITSIFYDDSLFNEYGVSSGKPNGKVLSVLIPGFNCTFSAPITVLFKSSVNETVEERCASWLYGSNDLMESIHGHWLIEQKPKVLGNFSEYRLCEYSHVTHFSLLVLGENTNISSTHKKALDIITAVGSGLSILGMLGVFLTAALFRVYRATNGVVINFSIAMTAQIILLFIADSVNNNKTACTFFGALLHYIVLAQFFWMLTIAVLQYQRYVIIFSSPPSHIVAKACIFAWGTPLLPVIIIVAISTENYGENSNGLCYAVGQYFTFGVLLPISLIILVNVMIFLRIMISVAGSRRIKVHHDRTNMSVLQLRLAFMLFFLLGLTWGFGLLASIGGSVVYSYLFCLTATLQGFVLFLFFIILNEKTRLLWINMKTCCGKSDEYDVNRDSAASVMMRKTKTTSTDTCTDSATSEVLRKLKARGSSDF
ncbi:hypothetical protein RN001_006486 [Aquatica leii]|uniref:G-protein coupled receptors family 2 profile 2 domain-containing protein n=1 Tax=Aquatica leii TaxID=1421715 RepID=A0AAN7PDK9_9COLE|nr:hypothetical protein RN001_006486 [Aquatica leii]